MRAVAVPQNRDQAIKPAYSITPLEGKVTRTVRYFNNDSRKIVTKEVEEPAGYMLRTMRGDEVRLRDIDELEQYGLTDDIPLIAEQIGEAVASMPNPVGKGK